VIDLDDVSGCPLDSSCICCRGTAKQGLRVCTVGSPVGVFCVTMCSACIESDELPNFAVVSAVRAVLEHCSHLGIDADQMAAAQMTAAMRQERGWPTPLRGACDD